MTGGAGADNLTGGGGIDAIVAASGSTAITLGGSAQNGTIAGYDVITDFVAATDFLDLAGAPVAAANTAGTNGVDSALRLTSTSSTPIKSHAISNGIITFSTTDTFGTTATLSSTGNVAAVVQYLARNDLGNAGTAVAFTATISSVAPLSSIAGRHPERREYILVDLSGVTIANRRWIATATSIRSFSISARPAFLAQPIGRGVQFDMDEDRDHMAWTWAMTHPCFRLRRPARSERQGNRLTLVRRRWPSSAAARPLRSTAPDRRMCSTTPLAGSWSGRTQTTMA